MEKEQWKQLEELCREALKEMPEFEEEHHIPAAVQLTGAFAASVQAHWEVKDDPDLT